MQKAPKSTWETKVHFAKEEEEEEERQILRNCPVTASFLITV